MPSKKSGRKTKAAASKKPEVVEKREKREKIDCHEASTSLLERRRENDDEVIRRVREMKSQLFPSNHSSGDLQPAVPSPTMNLISNSRLDDDDPAMPKLFEQAKECGNELTEAFKRIADQYN